jgi:predicted CoA-binding protein
MREWLEQIPREMLMAMDRQQLPDMPDIERMVEIVDMFREPEGDWTQMTD